LSFQKHFGSDRVNFSTNLWRRIQGRKRAVNCSTFLLAVVGYLIGMPFEERRKDSLRGNSIFMKKIINHLAAFAAIFIITSQALAKDTAADDQKVFAYSTDAEVVILSYSVTPEMLANPDLIPRIQVFGDGRVWVHYPHYMTKAGDYETWLNTGEMRQLLLAMSGVFDFDPKAVKKSRKLVKEAREQQEGIVHYRSEDTLEEMDVSVDSFQTTPGASKRSINQKLSWKNITSDAKDYPELAELQKLKGARNGIRALLKRDDLVRLDAPSANVQKP
jgi:hypothetical protein